MEEYWRGCGWTVSGDPTFLPADYMHLTYNTSREGLKENPDGCKKGKLVNEEMVRQGLASTERYKERGELKYEERLEENRGKPSLTGRLTGRLL